MSESTGSTTYTSSFDANDPYGGATPEGEGRVFTVGGGDWDDLVKAVDAVDRERIVVNMGPQHPSTHGVLRLVLELDGETVMQARPVIGYLHTGIEKNMEFRNWTQAVTFITRCDYLAPLFNEATYCMGVERLLGIEDQIPERVKVLRVLVMELQRISSHLVWLATGGMEVGARPARAGGVEHRARGRSGRIPEREVLRVGALLDGRGVVE